MLTREERRANQYNKPDLSRQLKDWQGYLFFTGFISLSFSWWFKALTVLPRDRPVDDTGGWFMVLFAILQAGGLLMATMADLDANRYLERRRSWLVAFAVIWIVQSALEALVPPIVWVAQVYWVSSLPFFLLLAAFTPIVEMREGYPRVTLLIALGFASVLAQSGIILMTTLGGPHPSWQQAGLGALDLLGAIVVTASYIMTPWKEQSDTSRLYACIFQYLIFQGLESLLFQLSFILSGTDIKQAKMENRAEGKLPLPVTGQEGRPADWVYGAITLLFPLVVMCWRPAINRALGKRWLKHRLQNVGTEFAVSEVGLGDLSAVEEAVQHGRDLNAYCPLAEGASDQYTLLCYSAGNGFAGAVEALLSVEPPMATVAVNKTSANRGHSPIYLAAQSGHIECMRLLIEARADVNLADMTGLSPLYIAALNGRTEAVRLLIDSGAWGADFNQEILLVAESKGHKEVVRLLIEEGAARGTHRWMGLESRAAANAENQLQRGSSSSSNNSSNSNSLGSVPEGGGRGSSVQEDDAMHSSMDSEAADSFSDHCASPQQTSRDASQPTLNRQSSLLGRSLRSASELYSPR